ncbi:glucuronate isomerase [Breznakiella homolactica]|uniref:Uronate isomerase n=1 Tax=Breznakiella homolactica TaxID=2798577 RepID=A0A7T8BC61_9SPIR|nr:glucuronate isomerase [Breznakiella homolactica]QQO10820.1 glucuronate isomerase [Breznakiella homolactica]
MKPFMDEDFILGTSCARELFHGTAKHEPIYDFHCHLIPSQIAENKKFSNITEIWLGGDHYKWRMMRTMGIDETYITGNADPYEKFLAWTRTVENLIGNPLYHWTHLELQRYFDIHEPLTIQSARDIWDRANKKLQSGELSVKGIFEKFNVYAVGTTDDPADTLEYHRAIAAGTAPIGTIGTRVIPSFRPDKALNIDLPSFKEYTGQLSAASGITINSFDSVKQAIENRLMYFIEHGCRASDHALEYPPFQAVSDTEVDTIVKKALKGEAISPKESDAYKTSMMVFLAGLYTKHDIVMQLHMASIRNNNARMFKILGPDTGYDASHDHQMSRGLSLLLNEMDVRNNLPKTILYTLNPKDYYPMATLMGCFQGQGVSGKIQLGSAWWFCDHRDGMEEQMRILGNVGMLSAFVGMLTDSRSFLSYPRHEYFRRILCNMIGGWVENGEFPNDMEKLSGIVRNISFGNAREYFK